MAIALVQDVPQDGTLAGTTSTVSITSTLGNTLVVCGDWYSGGTACTGISAIGDTAGNNWTYATSDSQNPPSAHVDDGGNYYGSFVAWTIAAAVVTSVTVTFQSSGQFTHIDVSEWAGINSADTAASASGTIATSGPTTPAGLTLAQNGEVIIGCMDIGSGSQSPPGSASQFPADATNYLMYEIFAAASGAQAFAWNGTGGPTGYTTALAALSPAGGTNASAGNAAASGAVTAAAGAVKLGMTIQGH